MFYFTGSNLKTYLPTRQARVAVMVASAPAPVRAGLVAYGLLGIAVLLLHAAL